MREKLIELLLQDGCPEDGCDFCQYGESEHCRAEVIADRLIANGVTIPVRCKDCIGYVWNEFDGCYVCIKLGKYNFRADDFCSYGERRTDA